MHEMHSIQVQREKETLEKIKQKVERIKANQQKYEPNVISAKTHYEGRSNIDVKYVWNICQIITIFFDFYRWITTAVRYNGKYLYEELVEKTDFNPRQNESVMETEESFLLKNQAFLECTTKVTFHWRMLLLCRNDQNTLPGDQTLDVFLLFLK